MPAALEDTLAAIVREQVAAALDERLPKYFGQARLPPRQSVVALEEDLLSKQDVARRLKVSLKTIERRMAAGELRACLTRPLRFAPSEVKRYVAECQRRPVNDVDQVVDQVEHRLKKK